MIVYLVGFMGSGKTTVGKKLAKKLNLKFIDLDKYIVDKEGLTINEIFEQQGENHFRQLETTYLKELSCQENTLISTGGGTPCFNNNMDVINSTGVSIYLQLNSKAIFNRLVNAKHKRPLLKDKNEQQLLEYINNELSKREPFYLKSTHIFNGVSVDIEYLYSLIM